MITVQDLTIRYGDFVLMKNLSFHIPKSSIFFIMGGSGCGKSSLLRLLTGLTPTDSGKIIIDGQNIITAKEDTKAAIMRRCGILYQGGALFSSMTLAENVALPLQQYTNYSQKAIDELVSLKLALVGLAGFDSFYPSEISGGMKKRAGLARALALDPDIVYFDEPSAGLDPISSKLLDDLIVEINQTLKTTIVIVSHELSSILSIGTDSIYLDKKSQGIIARGRPADLLQNPPNETIYQFLTRGTPHAKTTK